MTRAFITHLIGHYLLASIASTSILFVACVLGGVPVSEAVSRALFVGGNLAGGVIYWVYRRYGLWSLSDNLRVPKFTVLILLAVSVQTLNVAVIWLW